MALDEYLYGKLTNFFKQKRHKQIHQQETIVLLSEVKPKLSILASAFSGEIIDIFRAEKEGGYKNRAFFLPEYINFFETKEKNLQFYLFRTLYMCEQKKLGLNFSGKVDINYEQSVWKAIETSATVMTALIAEFPEIKYLHDIFIEQLQTTATKNDPFKNQHWLYGKWMVDDIVEENDHTLTHLNNKTSQDEKAAAVTHLKAKAIEQIIRIAVDKKAQEDYVLTHNFEKVETAEDFSGQWRDFDGEDELEKHQNALDELTMGLTVRVDDTAHSIYQSEYLENLNISESGRQEYHENCISYDEWDYKKKKYKLAYCKLYPEKITTKAVAFYERIMTENHTKLMVLRKVLANINNRLHQKRSQYEGMELDLDAVTDFYATLHAGTSPSENIYIDKRKHSKELSMLILLDLSLSSDGYVQGKRILDLEKEVAILFGEILHHERVDFSIAGFFSNTRNHTTYQIIKDFDDDWNIEKYVVGGVEAVGYTRIGTAIRHATVQLKNRKTSHKWLIILSDGKPNDFDRYEGKYGVEDVKQSLKELYAANMHAFAYAIEANAKYYLPQMFGDNHFHIIASPNDILPACTKLLLKLKNNI